MTLDPQTAGRFAQLALDCLHREYPNKISHILSSDQDVRPPRELTPIFYGCFDWHSAVHGHWMLARLARLFPHEPFAAAALQKLSAGITSQNVASEVEYVTTPGRDSFERPYGLAWLLMLGAELRFNESELARILEPLEDAAWAKLENWIRKLPKPDRSGQHANTAFALGLILDSQGANSRDSEEHGRPTLTWFERASQFFGNDRQAPIAFEPSGEDFLSPCLAEADLMRRLYAPNTFAQWLTRFLPELPEWEPVVSPDRTDGKLAHLDGLNLSRAWMMRGIANGLPAKDTRRQPLLTMAKSHRRAGLDATCTQHYEGSHWLGTFAVYLETQEAGDKNSTREEE